MYSHCHTFNKTLYISWFFLKQSGVVFYSTWELDIGEVTYIRYIIPPLHTIPYMFACQKIVDEPLRLPPPPIHPISLSL